MKEKLYLGWSEIDLTPDKRIRLAGQFYDRISQYVETPLMATGLAIRAGKEQAIIVSCDMTHVYRDLLDGIRANIAKRIPDFDPNKLIVNATHTHTSFDFESDSAGGLHVLEDYLGMEAAPAFGNGNVCTDNLMEPHEAKYYLIDKIADAAVAAWQALAPAKYAPAFGRAAVGMNRRVTYFDGTAKMWGDSYSKDFKSMEGGNDNGIEMLFIYDESGKPTGAVLNIACPSQVLEQRYFISSDYWGKTKIKLREKFGPDFKVLALCSPAGDLCPRDLVRWVEPETPIEDPNVIRDNPPQRRADPSMYDIKGSWKIGRRIANEVIAVYEEDADTREYFDEVEFDHYVENMPLPLRRVSEEQVEKAKEVLDDFAAHHSKDKLLDFHDFAAMHDYAGIVARYKEQQTVDTVYADVHVIRLGDIAIASDPFELFLDFANIIRARSAAKQTFLIQLANDGLGYLPTEKAELGGHYSAYVSSGCVGHEGGYLLAENTLKIIEKQFAK